MTDHCQTCHRDVATDLDHLRDLRHEERRALKSESFPRFIHRRQSVPSLDAQCRRFVALCDALGLPGHLRTLDRPLVDSRGECWRCAGKRAAGVDSRQMELC